MRFCYVLTRDCHNIKSDFKAILLQYIIHFMNLLFKLKYVILSMNIWTVAKCTYSLNTIKLNLIAKTLHL